MGPGLAGGASPDVLLHLLPVLPKGFQGLQELFVLFLRPLPFVRVSRLISLVVGLRQFGFAEFLLDLIIEFESVVVRLVCLPFLQVSITLTISLLG